jgi:hypothetical protein
MVVENIFITAELPIPKVYSINDKGLNRFCHRNGPPTLFYIILTKGHCGIFLFLY